MTKKGKEEKEEKDKEKEEKEKEEIKEAKKVKKEGKGKKEKKEKKEKEKQKEKEKEKENIETLTNIETINETKVNTNEQKKKHGEDEKHKINEAESEVTTIEKEQEEEQTEEKRKSRYKKRIDEIIAVNQMCNISPISEPILKTKHYKKFLKLMDYICYARIFADKILVDNPNIDAHEKKILKTKFLHVGVSQVHKAIKKKYKGILILAIDVFPIDIICHLPALCEEHNILYTYVTAKHILAKICKLRRSLTCLFIPQPSKEITEFENIFHKHNCIEIKNFAHLYETFEQVVKANHPFCKQ